MVYHILPYPRELDVPDFVSKVFESISGGEEFIHFGIADRLMVMHDLELRAARVFVKMRR